ncbi:hypothetical protein Pst134EA_031799 [Puccinia striiformis f. sp. tritici]|uniref:uncharacterized protein n=1 Tax=Puccinia striiformis f. sp. tritici TaxID=168172 RepID=UPI0020079684|nr:uncharacterized protein Pst134EA_031799 [Puccinia striiformis f. sp. tritici]KAH9445167.1 hypothetical protein Pst134EA_031799 [Puccinia striiformis f. sp. tritici]
MLSSQKRAAPPRRKAPAPSKSPAAGKLRLSTSRNLPPRRMIAALFRRILCHKKRIMANYYLLMTRQPSPRTWGINVPQSSDTHHPEPSGSLNGRRKCTESGKYSRRAAS